MKLLSSFNVWGLREQIEKAEVYSSVEWLTEVDGGTVFDPDDELFEDDDSVYFHKVSGIKGAGTEKPGDTFKGSTDLPTREGNPKLAFDFKFERIR